MFPLSTRSSVARMFLALPDVTLMEQAKATPGVMDAKEKQKSPGPSVDWQDPLTGSDSPDSPKMPTSSPTGLVPVFQTEQTAAVCAGDP